MPMSRSAFFPRFDQLGPTLPIFPLTGVLLLPDGLLPLNIFEPRYINMIDDALAGGRLLGMIQPRDANSAESTPAVYSIGCAGRITSFDETDDGRYLITLTGVSRFTVGQELPTTRGYRLVAPDWDPFRRDVEAPDDATLDRPRLTASLVEYFRQHGIEANWDAIANTPDARLVTSLAMICPFEPQEKQALLEAGDMAARADLLMALIEMAVLAKDAGDEHARH